MSFQSNKFLGLTCRDIKTSLSFGQSVSQLNVQLVQDTLDGDLADAPPLGSPVNFTFGSFSFSGLLQKFGRVNSVNGMNVYEADIIDPREILDGAQVITGEYSLAIPASIYNLYNVYGYWESLGFGTSESTPAGMPWTKVVTALNDLINNPVSTTYGRPLNYRGYTYSLDMSEVPRPPGYYRLPSGYLSLLEIIDLMCRDAGCDYFIQLVGLTIKVRVISRFFQPPLGTISALTLSNTYSGSTISADTSVESVNEVTSVFLSGGPKTGVNISQTIYSYWGTDLNGAPIIGTSGTLSDLGACEFAALNAADCADIVGSTTYNCSTWEMRYALWSIESWTAFIAKYRTDISTLIGAGIYGTNSVSSPKFAPDIILDGSTSLANSLDQTLASRRERLYDLVHKHAEIFYGKEFLVTIDGIQATQDAETGVITTSLEPTSAGWMEFGALEIGVPANRLDILQDGDERVLPFSYYENVAGADTSRISWGETAVDDTGKMWSRAQIDGRILFIPGDPPTPYVKLRLGGALYEQKTDDYGDSTLAGKILSLNASQMNEINKNAFGGTIGHIGIHPAARYPTAVGVPLKSNIEVYGPWFIAGAPGKVRVEQDSGLTPWDYGSSAVMDLAGNARVLNSLANQQVNESGSMIVAGAPSFSLGDIMRTGGPNLTNMEMTFGNSGVTTSYRWQTFTPKFGLFARNNAERVRRISLSQVQQRREFRKALNRAIVAANVIDKAKRGAKFNKAFWEKRQSPTTVIMAQNVTSGSDTRNSSALETFEASLNLLNTGDNYIDKAIMSVSGLVRGFSTKSSSTTKLSKYISIGSFAGTNTPLTKTDLDPFISGNDIEILCWGDTYSGSNGYLRGADASNTRAISLRGPIVITGWGPGIDGNKYPSGGGSYLSNYLRKSDQWMTGPMDPLWDNKRGVWTVHDIFSGVTASSIASGATGSVKIGNDSGWQLTVYNQWSSTIASGKKCLIGYCANENRLQFLAVDC